MTFYREEGQRIADLVEQIEAARQESERLEEVQRYASETAADLFSEAIIGAGDFKDAIGDVIAELGRMAVTQGFQTLITGTGVGQGAFGNILSGIFGIGARGPGKAGGGRVQAGTAYPVGERGMEWFRPDQWGTIMPNGGGGVTVNQVLNIGAGRPHRSCARLRRPQLRNRGAQGVLPRQYDGDGAPPPASK